jgi:hypothetical protein
LTSVSRQVGLGIEAECDELRLAVGFPDGAAPSCGFRLTGTDYAGSFLWPPYRRLAILDRMASQTPWLRALIGAACVVAGCTPSAAPQTSVPPSETPAEVSNLPPGCEPIELRSPAGEPVNLNGIWIQDDNEGRFPSKWWIQTLGDCIWGAGIFDDYTEDPLVAHPMAVQGLQGRVGNDFVIDSTIVLLGPRPTMALPQTLAEVRLLIEFDPAGQVTLREDRIPGVQGPRCPDPLVVCPQPLLLRRSG